VSGIYAAAEGVLSTGWPKKYDLYNFFILYLIRNSELINVSLSFTSQYDVIHPDVSKRGLRL